MYDYLVANYLNVPIYGGNILEAKNLSSKINSKLFLNSCGLPTAPGIII